jgi:phosphoinositide-3-kinase regulatory subunit 4
MPLLKRCVYALIALRQILADACIQETYDTRLRDLQQEIQEQIVDLLVDSSSVVKRAILQHTAGLCVFFGRQKTNDVLLSHMITYLNDREWLLREAFFGGIVSVAAHVGARSLEEYILPLMIQALSGSFRAYLQSHASRSFILYTDVEEFVVAKVLSALTSLADLGLFQKLRAWELMSAATGFLYHPNIWIRQGVSSFCENTIRHQFHRVR